MFLALGVGAWSAAIFHFMIHAFFKALLFLGAGSVIFLLHEEHDMFKMGGLRKKLPIVFITFLIGSASLAALPLITAGFYSKDQILWLAWSANNGSGWLWLAGFFGAFITSLYTFRMIFLTFFGEVKTHPTHKPGPLMTIPIVILAVLSLIGGFIELPENFGKFHVFSNLLNQVLPVTILKNESASELLFQVFSAIISITGVYVAYRLFFKKNALGSLINHSRISDFFYRGWGFDRFYDVVFVQPVIWLANIDKSDFIDLFSKGIASSASYFNKLLSYTQNGKVRWYAMTFAIGIVLIIIIMLNL
jgi:NADH-quinone oxidoreductase subunit L